MTDEPVGGVALNPNAFAEILAKNGEDLTDEDLTILISKFRAERAQVLADEQNGVKGRKKSEITKEVSEAKKAALASALKGLDLGLDNL